MSKANIASVIKQVRANLREDSSVIGTHFIQCDNTHFIAMSKCPDGNWNVGLTTLNNRYQGPRTHIAQERVVGWVYAALTQPQKPVVSKLKRFTRG